MMGCGLKANYNIDIIYDGLWIKKKLMLITAK